MARKWGTPAWVVQIEVTQRMIRLGTFSEESILLYQTKSQRRNTWRSCLHDTVLKLSCPQNKEINEPIAYHREESPCGAQFLCMNSQLWSFHEPKIISLLNQAEGVQKHTTNHIDIKKSQSSRVDDVSQMIVERILDWLIRNSRVSITQK